MVCGHSHEDAFYMYILTLLVSFWYKQPHSHILNIGLTRDQTGVARNIAF